MLKDVRIKWLPTLVVTILLFGGSLAFSQPLPLDPEGAAAREKAIEAYDKAISCEACKKAQELTKFIRYYNWFMSSFHAIDIDTDGIVRFQRGSGSHYTALLNFHDLTIHHPYQNANNLLCTIFEEDCIKYLDRLHGDILDSQSAHNIPVGGQTPTNISDANQCLLRLTKEFRGVLVNLQNQRMEAARLKLLSGYYDIGHGEKCNKHMTLTEFEEHKRLRINPNWRAIDLSTSPLLRANINRQIVNKEMSFVLNFAKVTLDYPGNAGHRFDCREKKKVCLKHLRTISDLISDWEEANFGDDVEKEKEESILGSLNCAGKLTELFTDFVSEL